MFTDEEQPLLTGTDEEIEEFVEVERCLIIDWRASEEETLDDAIRFLPEGALTYEIGFPGDETITIRLRFDDREDFFSLPFLPQNNFRVLLRLARFLQPDYEIKLFRCTEDADTHGFLLRPTEWWAAYRAEYPAQYERLFRELSELNRLWELDGAAKTVKPWWRFWS